MYVDTRINTPKVERYSRFHGRCWWRLTHAAKHGRRFVRRVRYKTRGISSRRRWTLPRLR
jgi:hypothetical protein